MRDDNWPMKSRGRERKKQEETERTEDDQRMDLDIAEAVRKHGWAAIAISDRDPQFMYTCGLMETFKCPELIIFGLDQESHHAILSQVVCGIRDGGLTFRPGETDQIAYDEGLQLAIRPVHATQRPRYLGVAIEFCRRMSPDVELQAMQVFWPDARGKFPFEAGCDLDVHSLQPRLDLGLTPREIGEFERRFE
jgi:hypothetical protein